MTTLKTNRDNLQRIEQTIERRRSVSQLLRLKYHQPPPPFHSLKFQVSEVRRNAPNYPLLPLLSDYPGKIHVVRRAEKTSEAGISLPSDVDTSARDVSSRNSASWFPTTREPTFCSARLSFGFASLSSEVEREGKTSPTSSFSLSAPCKLALALNRATRGSRDRANSSRAS